jgi:YidC/Oxa1 family membrane protein insertase
MTAIGLGDAALLGEHLVVAKRLEPGQEIHKTYRLYFGPKDYTQLQAIDPNLGNAVQLGWFAFFGGPLLWLLKLYHGWLGNWGLAIILLTFTMKSAFFPLTHFSMRSGARMAAIQPLLAELKEKHANEPEELNRKTIALFRDQGVNPVGGCLPMILQMPVWIALYNVLQTSVQLYHTKFLYLEDLSSPDPYAVLPLIAMGLMLLQQRMIPMGNMDPAQQRMMKLMPLIFGVLFFTFPSGLVVYMCVNTTLTMLQQAWFKAVFKVAPMGAIV